MDLQKAILAEHSKEQAQKITKFVGHDKAKFKKLMQLFLAGDYRTTQRAGWPLSSCIANHPDLATPYFGKLLDYLDKPDLHPAIPRNITRLFQYVDVPTKYQGRLMDKCFQYISSVETPIAIRAFSLTILEKLSKDYQEIIPELRLIIEENWDHATPAFRSRAKKIIAAGAKQK